MMCKRKKAFSFTPGNWLLYLFFFASLTFAQAQCPTVTIPPTACIGDNCGTGIAIGPVVGGSTADSLYRWIFTAPNGQRDTVKQRQPVYNFLQQGQYNVQLLVNGVSCKTGTVTVGGFSEFVLTPDDNLGPQDEEICKGSSITFKATFSQGSAPAGSKYLWSTGDTTETITVSEEKCYSLTITDPATGCTRSNKVNLTLYKPDPNVPPPPKEQSRWYFGNGSGIKFEGGTPTAITGNANVPEGTSSISDAQGNFLFYTDGRNVYDKDGNPMKDLNGVNVLVPANGLKGGLATTQGVLIVRQPGCNTCDPVYYIFTTTDITATGAQLYYSVVDMRLNGGLGQVMQKNVPLFNTSTERVVSIEATPDSTNTNRPETTWVVTHDFNTNTFRVYPLTPQGLGQPQTYNAGAVHGPAPSAGEGYMKVYDDKLVVVIPGEAGQSNRVEVFTFNSATGAVTGPPKVINVGTSPPKAYGVEIVGDSTLYVSMSGVTPDSSFIYGYNLNATKIDSTKKVVFKTNSFSIGALQLDPDGNRLYVAQQGQSALGEITNPANLAAAGYNANAIALTAPSQLGLPNTQPPDNKGFGQSFGFETPPCTLADTPVTIRFQAQPDRAGGDPQKSSYAWKFSGTSTTGKPFSQTLPQAGLGVNAEVSITFPGPGLYLAELTIFNDCLPNGEVIPAQPVNIPLQPPPLNVVSKSSCKDASGNNPSVTLDAYEGVSGIPGAFTYRWTSTANTTVLGTGRTFTTNVAGSYRVTVLNGSCQASAVGNVSFSGLTVNLGPDRSNCKVETIQLDAGNPGMNYQWVDGSGTSLGFTQVITVTPAATTTYKVTVTDPITGCSGTDEIKITVGQVPVLSAAVTNATTCGGTGKISISPADIVTYSYFWRLPSGLDIPDAPFTTLDPAPIGQYQIFVTNRATGCKDTIVVSVQNTDASGVKFTANVPTLGCNESTGVITLSNNTVPIDFYAWYDQTGNIIGNVVLNPPNFNTLTSPALSPGFYSIQGNYGGINNCTFAFTYEIKQPTTKPTVKASFTKTGCGQAELLASGIYTGTPVWTNSNGTPVAATNGRFLVTTAGKYTVTVGTAPCTAVDDTVITIDAAPPRYQYGNPPAPVCVGQTVTLKAPVTADWNTYVWVFPDGKTTFVGAELTTLPPNTNVNAYKLIVRNTTTGCKDSTVVNVTVTPTPPAPTVTTPVFVCQGSPRPALVATGQTGASLIWYADAALTTAVGTGTSFMPPIDTKVVTSYDYYVTQTTSAATGTCPGPAAKVTVTVVAKPALVLGPDVTLCDGTSLTIGPSVLIPTATYLWNTGQKTPTQIVTRKGTYILTVTSGGCSTSDTVVVNTIPAPRVALPRREVPVCRADEGLLSARLDAGPGSNFTYEWRLRGESVVRGTDRILILDDSFLRGNLTPVFVVTVQNGTVCSATDTVYVVDKCEPQLSVPQAFTPNDDGENDKLEIFRAYVGAFKMLVYNRWGEVIFVTEDFENTWDGTYKGQKVPPGTYTWKVVYTAQYYPERNPVEVRGGILVLR